jgi:predicted RNase H-like HicB family nuclease
MTRGGEMIYKVIVSQSAEGYSVSCPELPGCWSEGDTEEEALENIRDAIQAYLVTIDEMARCGAVREAEVSV